MTAAQKAIADFLANGGAVTRVSRYKRTMNEGQMHQAVRGKDPSITPHEERAILRQADYRKAKYGKGAYA